MMITPTQLAASGSEHSEQVAFMQWCATSKIAWLELMFAVPNGADYGGSKTTGARMKAEGLKAGVPDLMWPRPACRWAGLFIEMKKRGLANGVREEQASWHASLHAQGYAVVICYGWEAAVKAVETYLDGTLVPLSKIR